MNCAILYQKQKPPMIDGIDKPLKSGGYSDSGADISFSLKKSGISVVTPADKPNELNDYDWVFPDTVDGIQQAIEKGANTFWLNTVLFDGHPIERYLEMGYDVIGQDPKDMSQYDDKYFTNNLLSSFGLPIAQQTIIQKSEDYYGEFPAVLKPIRGRGSQGVVLVNNKEQLTEKFNELIDSELYGSRMMVEPFLCGTEVTVSVLPKGNYNFNGKDIYKEHYWYLPPVKRFNHQDGIAPYNGTVAVTENSIALDSDLAQIELCESCAKAAELLQLKALIRVDCRQDKNGNYMMFDINMKPNMTGASRQHRANQDGLTMLAASKIGWDYSTLLLNLLNTKWHK